MTDQWSEDVAALIVFCQQRIKLVKALMVAEPEMVVPATIVVVAGGALREHVLLGDWTPAERHAVLMQQVRRHQASAVLFFGDVNIRDLDMTIKAEALHGLIHAPGECAQVIATYQRNPLRFNPTQVSAAPHGGWVRGNPFDEVTVQ